MHMTRNRLTSQQRRQVGADGVKDPDVKFRYRIQLMNMTRFMDVALFMGLLKERIAV